MTSNKGNKALSPVEAREVLVAEGFHVLMHLRGTVQRDGLIVLQRNVAEKIQQTPARPFLEKAPWDNYRGMWETKIVSRLKEGKYQNLPVGRWFPNVRVVKGEDGLWTIVMPKPTFTNLAGPKPEKVEPEPKTKKARKSRAKVKPVTPVAEELTKVEVRPLTPSRASMPDFPEYLETRLPAWLENEDFFDIPEVITEEELKLFKSAQD